MAIKKRGIMEETRVFAKEICEIVEEMCVLEEISVLTKEMSGKMPEEAG